MRRALRILAVLVVLVIAAGAVLWSRGTYETTYRTDTGRGPAPAGQASWVRACPVRRGGAEMECARVHGRVIWVQHHDPDGDGDRHAVVAARFGIHVIKIRANHPQLRVPRVGHTVTAVGPVVAGNSERDQVAAEQISGG